MFSSALPERLKDDHDAQVDFTAPPGASGSRDGHVPYMQQSIFSMIAAVGSKSDFHTRFDDSSDSEGGGEGRRRKPSRKIPPTAAGTPLKEAENSNWPTDTKPQPEERGRRHRRTISENRLLRPFKTTSSFRTGKEQTIQTEPASSDELSRVPSPRRPRSATPRAAPVLSRMVEAQALLDPKAVPEHPSSTAKGANHDPQQPVSSALSVRLMEMFGYESPEKVVVEYACSLLQSMLLQGYMYVTEGHICFYAYLPRKSTVAIRSGWLHKRGRKNLRYTRYWFSLKGDVLSFYADPSNFYFPSGHVDLRYGISASLVEQKDKGKETKDFQVTTDQRTYYFRADSQASAKEWVKSLQKVIFRTHNDGDSVKISFPIDNIIDIEESPMVEFAETFKIRVVDRETYAIDESMTDTTESASQILNRSDVFHSPTIHTLGARPSGAEKAERRHSDDTARCGTHTPVNPLATPQRNEPEIQYGISESDLEVQESSKTNTATPSLNELVRAGVYPLQRAAGIAGYLKNRSKQMSTLLASESMGYFEKVSGMWAGGRQHYGEGEDILPEDQDVDPEDREDGCKHGDRFRAHFALPPTERLQATYFAHLHRVLPLYGKIYISQKKLCFRSLIPGTRTKMILPLKDVENVEKEKGFRFGYHGLVIIIRGHEELFFEFNASDARDDCAVTLHQGLESVRFLAESGLLAKQEKDESDAAKAEHLMLQEARMGTIDSEDTQVSLEESSELHPIFDDPRASIINFKPSESLRITCLTIGSRGDVQPYIALCKGLLAEGHKPKIATHAEFEPWVRKHGIDFAPVDGDPAELMRICVENGMFTYSFLREASLKFRGWIDDLLSSAWKSCQGSDLLIESPSAMAGIHIAEALRIPYFRAFTMPWTRTRAYPHAFAVPEHKMGGAYNYITYVMFDNVFWKAIAGQVNRWRKTELGLKPTNLDKMQPNKVPFLYNYSPSVVAPPLDYPDWIRITGYWFLSEGTDWTPPAELTRFIQRARKDGKKIVYIGFGSIVVSDPSALTRTVVESVQKADVRCILSKGWSDRLGDPASAKAEIPLPPEILQIQSAPHDWLFSQIDAAAHHGGAGTTGASLRAGVPTIIKPFFGDQFFFGTRVEDLGVGICMKKLNVSVFSRALWEATHSERMIVKARELGVQIRSEDGVATAIQALYRDLEYATTLARQRSIVSSTPFSPTPSAKTMAEQDEDEDVGDSEEWTFVGDDTDIDISRRVRDRTVSDADMLPEPITKYPSLRV
ncbi:Sterol 3-beta-glucosyltransferase [Aspergillus melleus]|uniref:Sterol 3-beta-glucosyltransferase n=1 Tax=Aspergillus melleus TaxID=138277 RepID=A0ACC3BA71_9EURO|nr:Sterol 3-beta-glucosyltransferase [Aspergillus melleus]